MPPSFNPADAFLRGYAGMSQVLANREQLDMLKEQQKWQRDDRERAEYDRKLPRQGDSSKVEFPAAC